MLTNVVRVGTENLLSELVMNSINNNDETNNGNTQCDTDKIKSSILTIDATSGSLHGETQNKPQKVARSLLQASVPAPGPRRFP